MRRQRWENKLSQNSTTMERITLLFILVVSVPIQCVGQTNSTTPVITGTTAATTAPSVMIMCPDNMLTNSTEVSYTIPTSPDDNSNVSCVPMPGKFYEGKTTVVCNAFNALNDTVASCSFNVTVDTQPPNATFTNCPDDILSNKTLIDYTEPVSFDGQDSLTVNCWPYSPGSSFPEGDTDIVCTAADEAGNIASSNCTFRVTVDTTIPVATFANCSSNILTNNATVIYSEPTAAEGNDRLNVSCDPPSGSTFPENDTTVICTASDSAGNVANETCNFTVTVDTISPVATFVGCPDSILTNKATVIYSEPTAAEGNDRLTVSCDPPSGSTFPENDTTVVCTALDSAGNVANETCNFIVTVDTISPVATFVGCPDNILTNNATVIYSEPTAAEGNDRLNVSCDPLSGSTFPENDTTVVCTASDSAGNVADETCNFTVTVDTISPVVTFVGCPGNILTNNATVIYSEPTAAEGNDRLNVSCDPPSGSTFPENDTTVICTASDSAGNVANETCNFTVTVDTIFPVATFVGCPDSILTNKAMVIYSEPTAAEGNDRLNVSCDPPSGSTFPENDTTVVCTALDSAGNVADKTCNFTVTVDTISPVATFVGCPDNILTNNATVIYSEPTAAEGNDRLNVSCDPPSGSTFPENDTTVVCTASDSAGNVADETCNFTVTVDTISPVVTFVGCPGNILTNNATVIYSEPTAAEGNDRLNVSCDPPSGSTFQENDTTVVCTASDSAGNVADETCNFIVTVDTSPPVLNPDTCPSDSSHYADYNTNSTHVTWEEPKATDSLDPAPEVTCLPQSNTAFEIGQRTVTCTAVDEAGNMARLTCTFQVNVTELRAPTINNISNVSNETMLVTWYSPDIVENFTVEYTGSYQDTETKGTILPGTENSYELASLVPGETYMIKVIAEYGLARAVSEERNRTTELNAPTITSVTSASMTSVSLGWRAPSNSVVERYIVEYAGIIEDTETTNMTLNGTRLSATLDSLLPGETYTLMVVASSGSVESGVVFAASQEEQETTAPMSVALVEIGSTVSSITAQWSAPTDPESSLTPVIEYYIVGCQAGDPQPERVNYNMSDVQASCVNLPSAGKEYIMTVASYSGDKNSSASIQIIALPNGVDLAAGISTTSSVSSSWVFPGGEAESFKISCSNGTPDPEEIPISNPPGPQGYEALCTGLTTPGDTYTMTVYVDSGGKASNSSYIQLTALPESVNVIVKTFDTTEVTLSWPIPSGIFTSFIASYSVGDPKPIGHESGKQSYEVSFTGLVPGREYTFSVVTLSGDQESMVKTVDQRTNPSSIQSFVSNTLTKTTIMVTWAEPTGDKDGYIVSISPPEGTLDSRQPLDTSATFSNLSPGKMYTVSVITTSGSSTSSSFGESFLTRSDFAGPVRDVSIDDIQLLSVRIRFDEPTEPNGIISSYRITYSGQWKDKTDPEKFQEVTYDRIPYIVTDLLAGYKYTFKVQAINEAGLGEAESASATTLTKPPPSIDPAKPDDQNESTKPTKTSVTARFLDTYFSHSNGELINYTVIIAQEGAKANTVTASPQTWSEVKDMTPIPPYQAFSPKPYPFPADSSGRRKRQATPREEQVVLGNENCQSSSGYCNGALRDDTSYVYLFRAWNEAGYADTVFSNPVKTLNDNSLELGLGLGLTFGMLVFIIIVLAALVIRRRRQLLKSQTTSNYRNEGFEHDLIPVRRKGNTRPVRVEDFPEHFTAMKADSDYLFSEEYEELRPIGRNQKAEAAVLDVNRSKNRFTNILPYDHTRVKLRQVDDEEGSDFVNANFMPGYNSPREFIACQGPLPGTEDDMWRLVWEQKVSTVVMVTQLVEKGRVKCHKYWPSLDKPAYFGDILVTLLSEDKLKLWTIRQFELEKDDKMRKVRHFNFTAWPDHGVPENTDGILRFVRNIRNQIPQNRQPTLVHCSAGVGRTGTFICLDRLMLHLKENDYADVFGIVSEMRMHRNFMVQTEDQYIFIHECLMDLLQGHQSNGSGPIYENVAV